MLTDKHDSETPVAFRWSYIFLPAAILIASTITAALFYVKLPGELAYHFTGSGVPDRWIGRDLFMAIVLLPQVLLTLVAAATTAFMSRLYSKYNQQITVKLENVIKLMGNVIALPEVVFMLFMLQVFLYNAFQIRLLTIWALGVLVMIFGGIFLAVSLFRTFLESRRPTKQS